MTHEQIDEMPAGPELDALACAVVGWEAKSRTCYCDGQWCRTPEYCDAKVWSKISTDIAVAMAALENVYHGRLSRVRGVRGGEWLVLVNMTKGDTPQSGEGVSAALAIARALAKMGAAR